MICILVCVQSKKLNGEVKGAVDVMEERLTEVKVMKQMELTEMTGKLGKYVLPHSRESAVHCFKFHNFLCFL
jgi:hypothetical protein